MLKQIAIGFLLTINCFAVSAQDQQSEGSGLPPVFLIGEYENAFETLSANYSQILLSVCNEDMDFAYDQWMDMLASLEEYADHNDLDIRGVKLYMYVFWNADGTIQHMAFYPKPNSRNIPLDDLSDIFKGFVSEYRLPIRSDQGFSHYASAAFPVYYKPDYRVRKD